MRTAVLLTLALLVSLAIVPTSVASSTSTKAPSELVVPAMSFPHGLFGNFGGSCTVGAASTPRPDGLINIPAAGTGISATYDPEELDNNTAVNATVIAPSPSSLSNDQIVAVGVGDPVSPTTFTAVAVGATVQEYILSLTAPVAYLPNGSLIENPSNTVSAGSTVNIEINHVHGYWWSYTYNGDAITGSSTTSSAWATNGTYNLGVSQAAGHICEDGYTVGPSFVALAYGENGAATPKIPTLSVPWAIGVEPKGSTSTSYTPEAANIIPQFNASLGTVGIEGHDQVASLGIDHLTVGSSVPFPGQFLPVWGNFKVVTLNTSTLTPSSASLAYTGNQIFNTTQLDQNGHFLPGVAFSWAVTPATLGTLNATTGSTVKLTAGSATVYGGTLWMNASYNCSIVHDKASVTVTPTGGPAINNFTANPPVIIVNGTTSLNVSAGPWPRAISYDYTGLPAGCSTMNVSSLPCTATGTGSFTVRVYLNDSKGHSSTDTTPLTVEPALAVTSFTASPANLTFNTTTEFKVAAIGGIPALTYYFTDMPTGCSSGYQPANFSCRPSAVGTFTPMVTVNDTKGHSVSATTTVIVNHPLQVTYLNATPAELDLGMTTYINVTTTGGTFPYSYAYQKLPAGCTTANVKSLKCTPTATGPFLVSVNVTDASDTFFSASTLLQVNSDPSITNFYVSPNPSNISQAVALHVTASGGTAPLSYAYTGLPSSCTSTNVDDLPCTPSKAGTYNVTVTVTDTLAVHASKLVSWQVLGPTSLPTISAFSATPATVTMGDSTVLAVTATGGTGALSYAYAGLPGGCTSSNTASLTCLPTATGSFTVKVFVNDTDSHSVNATTTVTVQTSQSSSNGSTSVGSLLPYLIIALIAVVAVVAIVLVLRKRKSSAPPQPPGPWQENPTGPAPPPGTAPYGEGPGLPPNPPA